MSDVKIFCPDCKDKVFWEGSLMEWGEILVNPKPPKWFSGAMRHQEATGHKIMVKYPSKTVPLGGLL